MIREMGNVELFELCETIPKVQCSECFLYWNQGVIYCICGHLLVESESSQKFNKLRLDALSIPHYVIKNGRPHGARHGKTETQNQYHIAFNAWKRCRKRVDGQEEQHEGIYDRFLSDQVFHDSQLKIGWTEQKCIEMDKFSLEDHSYRLSREEFKRHQGQWYLTLNKSGKNAPMRLRSDFRAAVTTKNRLHRESGEERAEPIPFQQYQRWHSSSSSDSIHFLKLWLMAMYCSRRVSVNSTSHSGASAARTTERSGATDQARWQPFANRSCRNSFVGLARVHRACSFAPVFFSLMAT